MMSHFPYTCYVIFHAIPQNKTTWKTDPQTALIVIQIDTQTGFTNTLLYDNPAPIYED